MPYTSLISPGAPAPLTEVITMLNPSDYTLTPIAQSKSMPEEIRAWFLMGLYVGKGARRSWVEAYRMARIQKLLGAL